MMLSFFTDLFTQAFLLRVLVAGILLGVLAPLIGSIVVIRRLSFIADTLGHFSLVGFSVSLFLASIGLTFFFEKPLYLGIIFSIIGGLLIELFRRYYKNYKEISMPIVMSIGTALSAIFLSLSNRTGSLYNYMFGSILTITNYYVVIIAITLGIVGLLFFFFGRQIVSVSFDESSAKYQGVNVSLFQFAFIITLSVAVSVLLEAAGVLLVSSMMIIPVAAAMKVGWSYKSTQIIGIVFSELSVILGLWASYSFRIPSGAAIVSISILILIAVVVIKRILTRKRVKWSREDVSDNR
jgi:zinc transport system permease protein